MILCANIGYNSNLPAWMFHAQTPPPTYAFNPDIPGITWVDLVFPFFLFTMGAAFPLAMRKKLESGTSRWAVSGSLFKRWITLTIFAIVLGNAYQIGGSTRPDFIKGIFQIILWGVMFIALVRVKDEKTSKLLNNIGLFLLVVMAFLANDWLGITLSRWNSDVIIMILANVAMIGGLIWMFTWNNLRLRWLILLFIIALKALRSYTPEAMSWVPSLGSISWFFSWGYLQYLVIAVAGSIVGDKLLDHARSDVKTVVDKYHITAGILALAAMLVQLWGLFTRHIIADLIISAVLGAGFVVLTWKRRNIISYLGYFGFAFMLTGILFDPIDGGITKDYCNLAYMITTTGMTALTGAFVLALELKCNIKGHGLSGCGQNPMLAYCVTNFVTGPVLAMIGVGAWLDTMCLGSPFWGVVRGLVYTLLMVAITCFFTNRKIFWRS